MNKGQRVLVAGSGSREHALAWKLAQSPELETVFVAPGNAGTARVATNVNLAATDLAAIARFVEEKDIHLTVIGPEAPLALGLTDRLRSAGRLVMGPSAASAQLEVSKSFAKGVMQRAGVPTASWQVFSDQHSAWDYLATVQFPVVVKADGLASGKGVTVCRSRDEAHRAIVDLMVEQVHGRAGSRVLIEEALQGSEVSLLAMVDGKRVTPLPVAKDHKRLGSRDVGPNTGGMGAFAPVPYLTAEQRDYFCKTLLEPVVAAMNEQGTPYSGVLFAGLMLTADGPKVLEFNCRFGDPETQVILPLIEGDLLPWLEAVATEALPAQEVPVIDRKAVGVVLACPGYPTEPRTGQAIDGLDTVPDDLLVFHGATALDEEGRLITAGGRVLTLVGMGDSLEEASDRAYQSGIGFDGMQVRDDIARLGHKPQARTGPSPATSIGAGNFFRRKRIGVLASGGGSNLQAILDACDRGDLDADVSVVVTNLPEAGALHRAQKAGVATVVVPLQNRRDSLARRQFEDTLLPELTAYKLDLIVLAGWMLVLSADFLARCNCPVINVHPALLPIEGESNLSIPVLRGAHAVQEALALELPYTGASVHFVTAEVDSGPVILRGMVPIEENDDEHSLHHRIKLIEHQLLPAGIKSVLSGTAVLDGVEANGVEEEMEKSEEELALAGGVYA